MSRVSVFQTTARICACSSFREKYQCPEVAIFRFEISPSTHTSTNSVSRTPWMRSVSSETVSARRRAGFGSGGGAAGTGRSGPGPGRGVARLRRSRSPSAACVTVILYMGRAGKSTLALSSKGHDHAIAPLLPGQPRRRGRARPVRLRRPAARPVAFSRAARGRRARPGAARRRAERPRRRREAHDRPLQGRAAIGRLHHDAGGAGGLLDPQRLRGAGRAAGPASCGTTGATSSRTSTWCRTPTPRRSPSARRRVRGHDRRLRARPGPRGPEDRGPARAPRPHPGRHEREPRRSARRSTRSATPSASTTPSPTAS